jgi:hypothetical protein
MASSVLSGRWRVLLPQGRHDFDSMRKVGSCKGWPVEWVGIVLIAIGLDNLTSLFAVEGTKKNRPIPEK